MEENFLIYMAKGIGISIWILIIVYFIVKTFMKEKINK